MNYQSWLNYAIKTLLYNNRAVIDAVILLKYVTGKTRSYLITYNKTKLTFQQRKKLEDLLIYRLLGYPIAYLINKKEFWSMSLKISPFVFIPRADTECLVEQALLLISKSYSFKILDLGTGVGSIALALAIERPKSYIIGVDINNIAISFAQFNARSLSIKNTIFYKSNWFNSLSIQKFHMIISNPPYISQYDSHLKQDGIRFEPKEALISGNDGLADIELIIKKSTNYLVQNGWVLVEHGWLQAFNVRQIFSKYKYQKISTFKDYNGNDRITIGQKKQYGN